MLQNESFTALNDPNEEKIRARIGVYYNHFTKRSDDENVVFSVPYNDTGGLGTSVRPSCRTRFVNRKTAGSTDLDHGFFLP